MRRKITPKTTSACRTRPDLLSWNLITAGACVNAGCKICKPVRTREQGVLQMTLSAHCRNRNLNSVHAMPVTMQALSGTARAGRQQSVSVNINDRISIEFLDSAHAILPAGADAHDQAY